MREQLLGAQPRRVGGRLLDSKQLWKSLPDACKKLDPRVQIKNPVMFVVEVGAVLTLYTAISKSSIFNWTIVVWLFLTVVFAAWQGGLGPGLLATGLVNWDLLAVAAVAKFFVDDSGLLSVPTMRAKNGPGRTRRTSCGSVPGTTRASTPIRRTRTRPMS